MKSKIHKIMALLSEAKDLITELEGDLKVVNNDYNIPIDALDITSKPHLVRFHAACKRKNLLTIGDLVEFGSINFAKIRNVGSATLDLIKQALYNQYKIVW